MEQNNDNNVYLTKEQKLLIVSLSEMRCKELMNLLTVVANNGASDEEYSVVNRQIQKEIDKLNQLCRVVYRK